MEKHGAPGQHVQVVPCSCPAISDAELFFLLLFSFFFSLNLKKALLMDLSPLKSSNPFPGRCKLGLFQEQQVKHDFSHSLAPGPAGREQHPPL